QVEYGLTTSYGSQTVLDSSLVTSHAQVLSDLIASTTYNYRVYSREAGGALTTSSNFTFTTAAAAATTGNALVYLKLDETGGTVVSDSSGNGLNGTTVNGPIFVTGKKGNAIKLNGSSQAIDLGNPGALQLTGSMTVSAWINSSSFPADDA